MSKEEVRKDLSQLLKEVDRLSVDDAERQRLNGLISDLERHLDDESVDAADADIVDTVEELATRLEADHPGLVGMLRRVMNTLASMGV